MRVVLTNDGSRTLINEVDGECFHSESGAYSEAKVVFLEHSGVIERYQQDQKIELLEIGFGTGLNFLLTADSAIEHQATLHYTGLDLRAVSPTDFRELAYGQFVNHQLLIHELELFLESQTSIQASTMQIGETKLSLFLTDAVGYVADCVNQFDIIYLDAFSPQSCPQLWSQPFLKDLYSLLIEGGVLVTYCCKSIIQDHLRLAGFQVSTLPGPQGGKRQVLKAIK